MKAEFIEWGDIRRECKYPQEDNNDGYIYGIAYLDDEGIDTLDVEWFKTDKERYEMAKARAIRTVMNFRQQLANLESEVLNAISDIRNNFGTFIFLSTEDIESGECDEYFEIRNDITGNVFDVHIVSVSDKGIKVVEANDSTQFHTIRVSDLASIQDKINLYKMLLQETNKDF